MPTAATTHLDDLVAQHLRTDVPRLLARYTVGEALAALREKPPEGAILYFYVVDDDDHLQGVVPTRRLILSPPETPLAEIMVRQVVALRPRRPCSKPASSSSSTASS